MNSPQTSNISANFDNQVDAKDFSFRFKKDKLGSQRATVQVKAGVPSIEGIVQILETGGKGLELLQDAMYETIQAALRSWVSDNENASQETLDLSKFSWDAIANQPREDRRSGAISEEQWAAFSVDYASVMPSVTGKSAAQVGAAVEVFLKKFSLVKTNKPVLNILKVQLGLYMEHSPNASNFEDVLELLTRRIEAYLKADDATQLIDNL